MRVSSCPERFNDFFIYSWLTVCAVGAVAAATLLLAALLYESENPSILDGFQLRFHSLWGVAPNWGSRPIELGELCDLHGRQAWGVQHKVGRDLSWEHIEFDSIAKITCIT